MRHRAPRGPRKLSDNLPVEQVVESAPCARDKYGGLRLRRLGQITSKTLECDPDQQAVDLYARRPTFRRRRSSSPIRSQSWKVRSFKTHRAAVECCGVPAFRVHSWLAEDSSSRASSTLSRLASVRPSCSNVLYPARATRNKINGLRDSTSWMGLLAPQPYPSKSLKISENFLGAERIGSAAARDCASSRDAAAGRPPQQGRSRSERARR